jgi:hypothetical protein
LTLFFDFVFVFFVQGLFEELQINLLVGAFLFFLSEAAGGLVIMTLGEIVVI